MHIITRRPFGQNYAFVVAAVVFIALLISAGLRSSPGVMMLPLEESFGWGRDTISLAAAVGILLYGLTGPFAAAMMETFGLRRTLIGALVLMSVATGLSYFMTAPWQLLLTWGVMSGIGSGAVAAVLGATVVNRWFVTNRGLMLGLLTASTASGTLVFLPAMAWLAQTSGWQSIVVTVSVACALLVPLAYFLVPERPSSIGQLPYGATPETYSAERDAPRQGVLQKTLGTLVMASKTRTFWILFGTFFICGFTTNGLIGTHLIAFCGDNGIPELQAAGLLALMGIFDLIGTTLSGWLTDRYDPRKLLVIYYVLRGISLLFLPFTDFSVLSLTIFAVFYGLDWIATVPPTVRLATERFGDRDGPIVYGWIGAGHQLGAACAALMAGTIREVQGEYGMAFLIAGCTALVAAGMSMMINRRRAGVAVA